MKLILSRKGFDASAGGVPSPILRPSSRLISLPIPEPAAHPHAPRYAQLTASGQPLGPMVHDLTRGSISAGRQAHLDPDLRRESLPRPAGWRPLLGQHGAAEKHLQRHNVDAGDIFLFFGWFREAEWAAGRYRYRPGAPDLHVIFGWLQVERHIAVDQPQSLPAWASQHPHCKPRTYSDADSIYTSSERLRLPGAECSDRPGAGLFRAFHPALQLTAPGQRRSRWRLPRWCYPSHGRASLTYHTSTARWRLAEEHCFLQTVGRGQEFILDCREYPEALDWLADLLQLAG